MARGYGKNGNSSGRGPVGKAPASRAPIVAAVKPKGLLGKVNPNASGGPVRTGGGQGSNKHVMVKPAGGSTQTRKTTPSTSGDFGKAVGNHVMGGANGGTIQRKDAPLHQPAQAPSRLGNEINYTEAAGSGRGCVGVGRTNHGPSGSQSTYMGSENNQGRIGADRRIEAPGPKNNGGSSIKGTGNRGSSFQPGGGGRGPGGFGFGNK
jgi:hypothetical protein